MRHEDAARRRTSLHRNGAHVSIKSIVAIGMMQADIYAQVDLMVLRIPPACIDDLIGIRRSIDGAITDAIIEAIVTVIPHPIAEAVRPVSAAARVTHTRLGRTRSRGRRDWTILVGLSSSESHNAVIEGIVWRGVVEDRALGSCARIGRI